MVLRVSRYDFDVVKASLDNKLEFPTSCQVYKFHHTSFGRRDPEPSPELLKLHWPYKILLYYSCEEDWQGESWEHCNPFYLRRGYWSLINCKWNLKCRKVLLTYCTGSVKCVGLGEDRLHLVIVERKIHTTTQCTCYRQAWIISSHAQHTHLQHNTCNFKVKKSKKI